MEITKRERERENVVILDITGEVIGDARFEMNSVITDELELSHNGVILNMENVPIIDSIALGIILSKMDDFQRKGRKIVILYPNRSFRYLTVITKTDYKFEKYDDEDEALESFTGPAA